MTSVPNPAAATEVTLATEPPPAPRAVTPHARRRCWTEPTVRLWWLLAIALAGVISYFCVDVFLSWNAESNLIRNGLQIDATVSEAGGLTAEHQHAPSDSAVTLKFDWNKQPIEQSGYLQDRVDPITVGEHLPIRVSAQDPAVWTSRTQPPSLAHALFPGLLFLPGLPLLGAAAWLAHRRVLRLWKAGEPTVGIIHTVRQSPIAPRTYALHCTYRDRRGKRLQTVFVPKRYINPSKGDALWLLAPPVDSTARPVAWSWLN